MREFTTMLTVGMSAAGPQMILQPVSPMVYLDHWALRVFSSDPALAARLTEVLLARHGTLALSWMNLGEFATVSDAEQRRQTERLIEDILPNIFCLEVQPFEVAKRELAGDPLPHAGVALAWAFLTRHQSTVKPLTALGLFEQLHNDRLADRKDALAATVQGRMDDLQRSYSIDSDFRKAVSAADSSQKTLAATRTLIITRTLLGSLIEDGSTKVTPNDAIDFLHAVVPAAHCDIVLLDGAWRDRIERAQRKLSRLDPPVTLAVAFSGRRDGIDRFLDHLWRAPHTASP